MPLAKAAKKKASQEAAAEAKAAEDYQQLLAYEPNFASACERSSFLCVFFF